MPQLITWVPSLAQQFAELARVATSLVPVLIQGETGTGKEVVARALHALSGRGGPFVAINCAAIPAGLVESTFFGHRRGAFSGAIADNPGLIKTADGGTLFLDEVADLPLAAQATLLRAIQEKHITPVGDTRRIGVDFRLSAASRRPLEQMLETGEFRHDLYARLHGHVIKLPPLRERLEDLGLLIQSLFQRFASHRGEELQLHRAAAARLFVYSWPMNIRELATAIEIAVTMAGERPLRFEHLPEWLRSPLGAKTERRGPVACTESRREKNEVNLIRDELVSLLVAHQGNLSAVARAFGKERKQIHRWLRKFGLDVKDYREQSAEELQIDPLRAQR